MTELSLAAAFLAGLMGGVHCAGMCGGIVTAFSLQPSGASARLGFHLAANLGRLASYVLAGAVAGTLGASSMLLQQLFPVEKVLYVVANLVLIALGLHLANLWQGVLVLERAGAVIWRRVQPLLGRVLPIRNVRQAFGAGLLWGWLPCGLVYTMLIAALASGDPLRGGLTLLVFGLGTLPNLLAMGLFAQRLQPLLRHRAFRLAAGLLVVLLGVLGLTRAV